MTKSKIQRLTGIGILSAIVVVLQSVGSFIRFGSVPVSLVLIPIVVGAALYGPGAGAFLGGVFSVVVLLLPDTAFFYGINFFGTVLTVLVKGTLAGLFSGLAYRMLQRKNEWLAVAVAALVCPIVNTGFFALGSRLFFWDALAEMGNGNAMFALLTIMIGLNFVAELAANLICAPVILRVLRAVRKQ